MKAAISLYLALDETSQYELTELRLALWLPQVLEEIASL